MGKVLQFSATVVNFYTENDVRIVGMADHNDHPGQFVIVSRLDEEGLAPEDAVGLQTHFFDGEFDQAILAFRVTDRTIALDLSAGRIGSDIEKIEIHHDSSTLDKSAFKNFLMNLFEGTGVELQILV